MLSADSSENYVQRRLVAEACGDGDFVAALGAATVEHSGAGLGLHAAQKSVNLAAATAVGLKGALGHNRFLCVGLGCQRVAPQKGVAKRTTPAWQQVLSIAELCKTGNGRGNLKPNPTLLVQAADARFGCCGCLHGGSSPRLVQAGTIKNFPAFTSLEACYRRANIDSVPRKCGRYARSFNRAPHCHNFSGRSDGLELKLKAVISMRRRPSALRGSPRPHFPGSFPVPTGYHMNA